jgi:hypothetical protein
MSCSLKKDSLQYRMSKQEIKEEYEEWCLLGCYAVWLL